MAAGIAISAVVNLLLGALGLLQGPLGFGSVVMMLFFAVLWGVNGWASSMGSPPGTISLSRWFPLSRRGTMYSVFSSTPQLGKAVSMIMTGVIVTVAGWQWGFLAAAVAGFIGLLLSLVFISDTPESEGLPSVQELSGEPVREMDKQPTKQLQKWVFRHPGIWVIAISTAFLYITQHAVSDWVLSGILSVLSLAGFLFLGGGFGQNMAFVALFSFAFSVVFCIVAGLMALDFVPRKATGAALGIVGISSYAAAGLQSVVSGYLIQDYSAEGVFDFGPVSLFWIIACLLAFVLPVIGWKYLRK